MSSVRPKVCLISSSGGHYEQLKKLAPLEEKYNVFWVTEETEFKSESDYYLPQTGYRDKLFPIKMLINFTKSVKIYYKERPDFVITTGTMVAIPLAFIAKICGKKLIYIETFARIYDGTKTGKLMNRFADLFIIQWESLQEIYPNAIYGGSIY